MNQPAEEGGEETLADEGAKPEEEAVGGDAAQYIPPEP